MKELYKKLQSFQAELDTVAENSKGFGYTYADLNSILTVIRPLLKKNHLGFYQKIDQEQEKLFLSTVLFDFETGQEIVSKIEIRENIQYKGMNEMQSVGATTTYLRRYALSAILGISTDKDTDASGETKPPVATVQKRPTLSPERFEKAMAALKKGSIKMVDIAKYDLTDEQKKILNNNDKI